MSTPALTPREYADAYRYWQQQHRDDTAREIAGLLDQHTIQARAAWARAEAVTRHHDTPEAQATRRTVLLAAISTRKAS